MSGGQTHIPKVSVVIPMYNCEQFIPELFPMFLNQSFTDFEVICVIDGATDNTEKLVRENCKADPRFRYVVQEHGGAALARNSGLELARGEYVIFSDADDEYHVDYLKKLYDTAIKHDAQIVICRFTMRNYYTQTESVLGFDEKKFQEDTPYSHLEINNLFGAFVASMTNKLFSTRFIRDHNIRFPKISIAEDACFFYFSVCLADRILVVNDILTCYRLHINPESVSDKRTLVQHEAVDQLRLLYRWLKKHSLLDRHGKDYARKVNASIIFAGKYDVNPRYISECAHMLNAEEPWETMPQREIVIYLNEALFAEKATKERDALIAAHSSQELESDKELASLLDYYNNRIRNAKLLRKTSKDCYGRRFKRKDSIWKRLIRRLKSMMP